MNKETFHGQSTKQNYKNDIEDSLKQKTVYKIYEYLDDYSYGNSDSIGIIITKIKEKPNLILFQSDGPNTENIMRKLLEWRKSGSSDEVGHKGGGNKRNIYGFKSIKTYIFNNLGSGKILRCDTSPNKIYELSNSDISEDEFRNRIDTSEFITVPEIIDEENLPIWYQTVINKITTECEHVEPNYLIRMELTELPEEFTNQTKWNEFINQIRAKQYIIPIYFKNELLNMETYETYANIDLVGFNAKENEKEKSVELYINNDNSVFYLKNDNKYINVDNGEEFNDSDIVLWGEINMFVVNEKYFQQQLKEYNTDIESSITGNDVYGVYLKLNNKLTNYKPIDGNPLVDSKNNGIKTISANNTNKFRMIIIPNNNTCINPQIFNALIRTETIKALSGFLDKSPYKLILKRSMDIYKGKTIEKPKYKPPPPTPKPTPKKNDTPIKGAVYIIYIACGLWKYGLVMNSTEYNRREKQHKNNSIETVKKFTDKNINDKTVTNFYCKNTESPKGAEENIKKILLHNINDNNGHEMITMFENRGDKNDCREYFTCNDIDYITQKIIPLLSK
jgi:hypothetical protein